MTPLKWAELAWGRGGCGNRRRSVGRRSQCDVACEVWGGGKGGRRRG